MNPIFFTFGTFTVRWYGVMIAVGFISGILLSSWAAKRKGLPSGAVSDFALWAIIAGLVGARLYYIAFSGEFIAHLKNPLRLLAFWEGGLAIHGGVLGGLLAAILYARRGKLSFWKLADVLTPGLLLGHAVGRIGCFLNGDAFGVPTRLPWGAVFPKGSFAHIDQVRKGLVGLSDNPLPVHPTQLYEATYLFITLGILLLLRRRLKSDGMPFLTYVVIYSVGRFLIESVRADQLKWGVLSAAQSISVIGAALAVGGAIYLWRRSLVASRGSIRSAA
jgi:phosphatidylglycerol:prolipoprotein diacylglycerol transferase